MKTKTTFLVILTLLVFITLKTIAQPPEAISYQAVIRNNNNELIKNTQVKIKATIYSFVKVGNLFIFYNHYIEEHTVSTNENGLATLSIGKGTPTTGKFDTIPWQKYDNFNLKIEVDPNGGNNFTISATSPILSVPFSLYSKKSMISDTARNGIIAYGNIASNGTINKGSNNFTVEKPSTGVYHITWTDNKINTYYTKAIVSITPVSAETKPYNITFASGDGGKKLLVYTFDYSGAYKDCAFSFVVFNPF